MERMRLTLAEPIRVEAVAVKVGASSVPASTRSTGPRRAAAAPRRRGDALDEGHARGLRLAAAARELRRLGGRRGLAALRSSAGGSSSGAPCCGILGGGIMRWRGRSRRIGGGAPRLRSAHRPISLCRAGACGVAASSPTPSCGSGLRRSRTAPSGERVEAPREHGFGGAEHHRHVAPFLHRALLDDAQLGELLGEAVEDRVPRSGWVTSRPRNMIVTLTLSLWRRKRSTWCFLVS